MSLLTATSSVVGSTGTLARSCRSDADNLALRRSRDSSTSSHSIRRRRKSDLSSKSSSRSPGSSLALRKGHTGRDYHNHYILWLVFHSHYMLWIDFRAKNERLEREREDGPEKGTPGSLDARFRPVPNSLGGSTQCRRYRILDILQNS